MKSKKETKAKRILGDFLYNIAGSILYAAGIYTFAGNAGFAPGGVSGLALIMDYLWGLPVGTVTLLLNIPLVIISYRAVGKRLLLKSATTMVISSLFLDLVFPLFPMYSGDRLIASVCSGALLGAGMALFYIRGSSSGGIDFLVLAVKKKNVVSWPVFGDVDAVLYGVLATFTAAAVVDKILYGVGAGTLAVIITGNGKAVAERIGERAARGVTSLQAVGAYTGKDREVLLCACSKAEAYLVKEAVQEADKKAFFMFTEISEVYGEGFKRYTDEE